MATYKIIRPIRHLGLGLERQPDQIVSDAEFAKSPGWKNDLLASGAIVLLIPETMAPEREKRKAVKHAV